MTKIEELLAEAEVAGQTMLTDDDLSKVWDAADRAQVGDGYVRMTPVWARILVVEAGYSRSLLPRLARALRAVVEECEDLANQGSMPSQHQKTKRATARGILAAAETAASEEE